MKNHGNKLVCLILGTVIVLWIVASLPQWFGNVEIERVAEKGFETGNTDAARNIDDFADFGVRKVDDYEKEFYGSVCQVIERHSVDGFSGNSQTVLQSAYDTVDAIITTDMTELDKVKAIHDYLIQHADYYSGNLNTRPGWSSAAEGVLLHGSGVCNSYAFAFYIMCTAEGIECHVVSGMATNSTGAGDHAWNRVRLGDTWYYIDCTWDDPVGGGTENYDYYLTTTLWSDHEVEREYDPGEESFTYWREYYLTGEKW